MLNLQHNKHKVQKTWMLSRALVEKLPAHSAAELKLQHRILMLPQQEPVSHQAN
jgi:hypothetical protein